MSNTSGRLKNQWNAYNTASPAGMQNSTSPKAVWLNFPNRDGKDEVGKIRRHAAYDER